MLAVVRNSERRRLIARYLCDETVILKGAVKD